MNQTPHFTKFMCFLILHFTHAFVSYFSVSCSYVFRILLTKRPLVGYGSVLAVAVLTMCLWKSSLGEGSSGILYHVPMEALICRALGKIYIELKKGQRSWMGVRLKQTWKLLDDENLPKIDEQVL